MHYDNIFPAKFITRHNRFVADIEIDGKVCPCHVKNTGRCKELLIPGSNIFVQSSDSQERKTKYDLISVYKGKRLINIDSQVPNKVFKEWAIAGGLRRPVTYIKPEFKYKNSRFDFYMELENINALVEVKGVTLEDGNIAMFPDAPTERGVKHVLELIDSLSDGYKAYIVFVIQMRAVTKFRPNDVMHKAFGDALRKAHKKGVEILAFNCDILRDSISPAKAVQVIL